MNFRRFLAAACHSVSMAETREFAAPANSMLLASGLPLLGSLLLLALILR
jgi:hypothetical protein